MTIDEAIKKIQYVIADIPAIYSDEVYDALKLSIEALSYYQILRIKGIVIPNYHLPGETES